jgi:hypothetical protein
MAYATPRRRTGKPIRLYLADDLGHEIDGAWWPYTADIAVDRPDLVAVLEPAIGKNHRYHRQLAGDAKPAQPDQCVTVEFIAASIRAAWTAERALRRRCFSGSRLAPLRRSRRIHAIGPRAWPGRNLHR